MENKKGFTLIELIIVLVILGVIIAVSMPAIMASIEQEKAQTAQNNLMALAAAESKYYEDNNTYCTNTTGTCAGLGCVTCADLFASLQLSMTPNDQFTYNCWFLTAAGSAYTCQATDNTDTLTLNPTAAHPVICTPSNLCPANLPSS